jgi:hypothetical protein
MQNKLFTYFQRQSTEGGATGPKSSMNPVKKEETALLPVAKDFNQKKSRTSLDIKEETPM